MNPYVIGIAGGSGTGKSTLAFGLRDRLPGKVTILHLDDYFRKERAPRVDEMINWDHPDTVDHEQLVHDLSELKGGKAVVIGTKNHEVSGAADEMNERRPVRFEPAPLIIVEGFLALAYPNLRQEYDLSIYLELPFDAHIARRLHFLNDDYLAKVLRPMHQQYVVLSAKEANQVIEVAGKPADTVLREVIGLLPKVFS